MSKILLLVEGKQEYLVIPELMRRNDVSMRDDIPEIIPCNGASNLLKEIPVRLKESSLSVLGVIVDADDNPVGCWDSIKHAARKIIPDLPKKLPEDGLIHEIANGVRFGVWIMPNNKMRGMLETFLADIIPEGNEITWEFAKESVREAKNRGAKYTPKQIDKANIYTWLAWQDPPDKALHLTMWTSFAPTHPNAQKFVTWFKELYGL